MGNVKKNKTMNPEAGIEIWKAVAMTALGVLQVLAIGLLFYVIRRLDAITKDAGRTRERLSHIEGHMEASDESFRPAGG